MKISAKLKTLQVRAYDTVMDTYRWQTDDFWQYALFAAVAYIRAAASRAGVPVRQACQGL